MRVLTLALLASLGACREAQVRATEGAVGDEDAAVPLIGQPVRDLDRARRLYAEHCALCHGQRGEGDGEAAHLLYPPARDFTLGFFRLATTENGVPTDEDLIRTLRRGMPGSAMPPFDWMAARDLSDLARLVRSFAHEGLLEDLRTPTAEALESLDDDEARAIVDRWLEPGPSIEPLPPADPTSTLLAQGRRQYLRHCAGCHGLDGRGRGGAPKRHEDGSLTWARDFTSGILKGGGSRYDLTCRIQAGLAGSAMPATDLSVADLIALVAYVEELIPTGAPERHRQVRTRLVAERLDAPPDERSWDEAEERDLRLAPLAWNDRSLHDVTVQALHDRERLWMRLSWRDETRDDRLIGGVPHADAAAVQLSTAVAPPLFGMGSEGAPVNLWHWSAVRWSELAGMLGPLSLAGHAIREGPEGVASTDAPLYRPAPDDTGAVALEAEGFRRIDEGDSELEASAEWKDGRWELVLSRELRRTSVREVDLVPGRIVQFGVALWNGSAGDHRGQKSITIWHELELAR